MSDPKDLDEYNERCAGNMEIDGYGMDVVTHFPCPGCGAPGWMDMPIVAAMDDYASIKEPSTCNACGRVFRIDVQESGDLTSMQYVLVSGDDMPDFISFVARDDRGS